MFLNENNCKFYDKYFIDDLYSYKFNSNNNTITYYDNGSSFRTSQVDMSKAIESITSLSVANNNYWTPAFIDLKNSKANSRVLFRGATSFNENLGIENAIVIKDPLFQNWNVTNGNMVSDWILTSDIIPFSPRYGILFWYRNSELSQAGALRSDQIPYNCIVNTTQDYRYENITISSNSKLAKKDNDTFYILDTENPKVAGSPIASVLPSTNIKYFKISKLLSQSQYSNLKKQDILFRLNNTDSLIESKPSLSIWIPSGETYSYVRSLEEEQELKISGVASSSYLSPILSNIYREIYHVLTLRYPKNFGTSSNKVAEQEGAAENILEFFDPSPSAGQRPTSSLSVDKPIPFFTPSQSKLIKKLAYALATMPIMDRTTVSLLNTDNIYNIIQKYLTEGKENLLYSTLTAISQQMSILMSHSNSADTQSYLSGLVSTKEQLFYKLISKYGAKLRLSGKASISYNKQLKYGPHVKINQDIISRCNASLNNQTVFNNVRFNVGSFVVNTAMSPDTSKLILSNKSKSDKKVTIPLWDVVKKDLKDSRMPITAGPDLAINFDDDELLSGASSTGGNLPVDNNEENPTQTQPPREIEIELNQAIADVGGGFFDENILGGEEIDVLWTRISGPDCLRFSNNRLSNVSGQGIGGSSSSNSGRYATSTDSNPTLYIKKPGRYVVQLRVKASFGVIYDNVVIHVISSDYDPPYKRNQGLAPAKIQDLRPQNQLVVMVPNIRECYFGKQGVFWVSYCDASVKTPSTSDPQENVGNMPQISIRSLPKVVSLGNNYHKFGIPMPEDNGKKIINNKPVNLFIDYDCNNTTIDISHITLTNLMDDNPECYNCESLYEGILDSEGFFVDGGNGGISFLDPSDNDRIVTLDEGLGDLTTSRTLVRSYGGFPEKVIDSLGLNIPYHPKPGQLLTNIATTGELLNEPKGDGGEVQHLCHDTDIEHDATVIFNKGCFHPNYGWIDNKKYNNQSAVLKFDPYHRPVQSFKGPGMYDLNNDFSDGKPRIYRSSISFNVDSTAHDPVIQNAESAKQEKEAKERAELPDHINHYGYKSIGGEVSLKSLALNDEYIVDFPVEDDAPVSSDDYCSDKISESSYTASYTFSRPGTHIPAKLRSSDPFQRWNREGASSIGNIEVKINFLNYINPKDLVVWLEIGACGKASQSLSPPPNDDGKKPPPRDAWYDGSYVSTYTELSKLPNTEVKNYLYSLWQINDNNLIGESKNAEAFSGESKPEMEGTYRVYLLNRDHISSTDYNINLKFSDLLDLDKLTHNHNNSSVLYIDNNISESINNTINLAPTLSAAGYSDEQIYKYKKIIIENRLLNNSHSFRKISGMPLFAPANTQSKTPPAGNSSSTTFTLCVAVVGESDTFEPYDRVFNSEEMCGFDSCVLKNRSSLVANSICSWELILHRQKDNLGFVPGDTLGSIKYESEPDIPGYNFIADLSDKLHLLPPAALNAPNAYLLDGRLCRYSKDVLNQPTYLPPPPMNISPITFMMPASAVAAVAAVSQVEAGQNQQTQQIVGWLGANRRAGQKELFNREWFVPVYDKYPYGGCDKALLSISKDGQLFYKTEAAIFRYNNSVVMQKNQHNFCRLHYKSYLKNLSIFRLEQIKMDETDNVNLSAISKLFKAYIKTYNNIAEYTEIGSLKDKDIIKLKTPPDAENEEDLSEQELKDALAKNIFIWDKENDSPIHIEECSFSQLFGNENLSSYSNIYDLSKNTASLNTLIKSNKFRYIKGLRSYHFFNQNRNVTILKSKDELTETENNQITSLRDEIKRSQSRKAIETDATIIDELDISINDLENQIFDIQYIKNINNISNIGYIFDGTEYYTVLVFDSPCLGETISISPDQSSRTVIYNKNSTIENNGKIKKSIPVDLWSIPDRSQIHDTSPEIHPVFWGAGNYGYGGNAINLSQISLQNIQNKIIPLIDRIDSNKNSKLDPNTFKIFDEYDDSIFIDGSVSSLGYGYDLNNISEDSIFTFNSNAKYIDADTNKLSKTFFDDINERVYVNKHDTYSCIELNIKMSDSKTFLEKGIIRFNKDIEKKIVYGFEQDYETSIQTLKNRIEQLPGLIKSKEKLLKSASKQYIEINDPSAFDIQNNQIKNLIQEQQTILYYLNLLETDEIKSTIPHVSVSIEQSESGSINFKEKNNNNYYWINIDPEQGCSIDKDRTVKILKEVSFTCVLFADQYTKNADQICGGRYESGKVEGRDEVIDTGGIDAKYSLSEASIKKIKNSYPDLVWPENDAVNFIAERKFFLNLHGKEKAQQVIAKYNYITPLGPAEPDIPPDGDVKNKVYNIFNLDKTNELIVEFKRIPRAIKGVDTQYEIFEPNDFGELTKSITPPVGGPIDASLRMWKCLDPKTGAYIKPPVYYNWLNEMIFRLYFGSADGIEYQGRNKTKSKDIMYWIPYDYS